MKTTIPTSWALYVIFIASFIVFILPSPSEFFASKKVTNYSGECEACSSHPLSASEKKVVCAPGLECSNKAITGGATGTLCVQPGESIDYCLVVDEPPTPKGCHYLQIQCITAPCDPVLVCPSSEPQKCQPVVNPCSPHSCDYDPAKCEESYTCPDSEWVDCMPGPSTPKLRCQKDYLDWMRDNCPNFQGAAY